MTDEPREKFSMLPSEDQEAIRKYALGQAREDLRAEQAREKATATTDRARAEAEKRAAYTVQLARIDTTVKGKHDTSWRLSVRGQFTFFNAEPAAQQAFAREFARETADFMAGRL